jgi:hypothetical protein
MQVPPRDRAGDAVGVVVGERLPGADERTRLEPRLAGDHSRHYPARTKKPCFDFSAVEPELRLGRVAQLQAGQFAAPCLPTDGVLREPEQAREVARAEKSGIVGHQRPIG